jgi:signal transduction histidine kinase
VKRLLPRSLYGRMVMILLGGLLAAQILGPVFLCGAGNRMLRPEHATHVAQHIADVVALSEATPSPARAALLDRIGGPGFRVELSASAAVAREFQRPTGVIGEIVSELQKCVGDRYPISAVSDPGDAYPPRRGAVAVQVHDGEWLTFHLGPEIIGPPSPPPAVFLDLAWRFLVVVALTLIAVRLATRPLAVLAAAADELGQDIGRAPLAETGPTEVRRAAQAFNKMQARLARYIEDRSRVLAAVSHDLKTPITRLRLRTELLDNGPVKDRFVRDLDEMEQMAVSTLDFMRGFGAARPRQRVDLMALLESIGADVAELGGTVEIDGSTLVSYLGYAQGLKRCLSNLVDNALRYAGQARMVVEDSDAALIIRVQDRGPGIPDADLERVFEPFYRIEGSRNRDTGGTGLGLPIARDIARLHGGDLTLRNLPDGGLEATVTLPRTGTDCAKGGNSGELLAAT